MRPVTHFVCFCCIKDVTPSAVHVGNIVQGVRLAWAQGRDIGSTDDDSDAAKKVHNFFLLLPYAAQCLVKVSCQ